MLNTWGQIVECIFYVLSIVHIFLLTIFVNSGKQLFLQRRNIEKMGLVLLTYSENSNQPPCS